MDEESLAKKLPEPFPGTKAEPALMAALLQVARENCPNLNMTLNITAASILFQFIAPEMAILF